MLVNVRVYKINDRQHGTKLVTMEDYVVGAGSVLQSESRCGPIYVEPVTEPVLRERENGCWVAFSPQAHLYFTYSLVALVNGSHQHWGRNGDEWMVSDREDGGGTFVRRAQRYAQNYREGKYGGDGRRPVGAYANRSDCPPVSLSAEEVAYILGETMPPFELLSQSIDGGLASCFPKGLNHWETETFSRLVDA